MAIDAHSFSIREMILFLFGIVSGLILFWGVHGTGGSPSITYESNAVKSEDFGIPIPMESFPEEPWRTPATLAARVGTLTSIRSSFDNIKMIFSSDKHAICSI